MGRNSNYSRLFSAPASISGVGGGSTNITVVANYSALPAPVTVATKFYWASAEEGSNWNPFVGAYRNAGLYYSNGVSWEYLKVPYQATQAEVDAGVESTKFVIPATLALATTVVHTVGNETVAGVKTFTSDPIIPDEAYGVGWNGVLEPPTKNAIYDYLSTLSTGAVYWSEARNTAAPNATVPCISWLPNTADTNNDAVIGAKGTGAILAQIPDNTTTGGNKRGIGAVDLQMYRAAAANVAYGNYSVVLGYNNKASGNYSFAACESNIASGGTSAAFGTGTTASGAYSFSTGDQTVASGDWSFTTGYRSSATASFSFASGRSSQSYLATARALASGQFAAQGDAQSQDIVMRVAITGTAIAELLANAAQILIPSNKAWKALIEIVVITTAVGNGTGTLGDVYATSYRATIKNIGGTTALVGTPAEIGTLDANTSMSTAITTISADNTNDALKLQWTPPTTAGLTSTYRAVATVHLTEVGY